ncbi:hypothetical protein ARAM_006375 [Aspergillus rambellii]|uniref:Uncharacterized protein n=1 Tax=Aspergillus rambellii TaxID=308745 RepID=A0A0F8X0T4_9EURO|nr:hypothetical protein ARAM_006375 [Aspergillus rambellii]
MSATTKEIPEVIKPQNDSKNRISKKKANKKARCVPRQDSPNVRDPRNRTLLHPEQAHWSWTHLPDILYQFKPEGKVSRNTEPPRMTYPIHGRYLRELSVLPDNISSAVEEYQVEAWMRLDRRIHLKDITDRMHPDFRVNQNALQQRGVRFRQAFNMIAWDSGNKRSRELEAQVLKKMEEQGLDLSANSTRGLTPGLINPNLGEEGGRIPNPPGYSDEKRKERAKRAKKVQAGLSRALDTILKPECLVDESMIMESFVPYDESLEHADAALPVIRGEIPDDQLPSTVNMQDLDLSLGFTLPTPQPKRERTPMRPRPAYRGCDLSIFNPSSTVSPWGFCNAQCYPFIRENPKETLQEIHPTLGLPDKPQSPTLGLFPPVEVICLNTAEESVRANVFDAMLAEYYAGARHLVDMPYM